jgi:hypothetical protein
MTSSTAALVNFLSPGDGRFETKSEFAAFEKPKLEKYKPVPARMPVLINCFRVYISQYFFEIL